MSTLDGGQTVGRYRIERFLGAGAMGEVYLAQDPHIERPLAIKTVRLVGRPQEIDDRKKRLLREAKAAGRLLHPNIVTLFDAGEAGDVLYLAFEFVEGADLSTRVGSVPPLSLREVLRILQQCAEALDYAHRQGIVHRDIKPSNILLDTASRVKVADFGIAKMAGQSTELTMAGSVMGSPQYLSPEQIRGEELDGRSDIFSLGVVLFELLSGKRPFDGDTITTLVYQILHKEPPKVSELRGGIPPRLEQLLSRMLAKDRDERMATAGLVAEELKAIERELPDDTLEAPAAASLQQQVPTYILPRRTTAAVPAAPAASETPTMAPAGTTPPAGIPAPASGAVPQRSRKGLWLALAAVLLVFVGLAAVGGTLGWRYYQRLRGQGETVASTDTPAATANPAAPAPSPASPPSALAPPPGPAAPPPAAKTPGKTAAAEVPVVVGQPIQIRSQPPPSEHRPAPAPETSPPAAAPPQPVPAEPAHRLPPVPPARNEKAEEPAEEPAQTRPQPEANQQLKTSMSLAFRGVTPQDAFILVDGTVIGRAEEWSGGKGSRPYTLSETGEHLIKIRKPGLKEYRIAVEASETSGTTQVTAHLQALPTAEVAMPDLQSYRVRKGIAFKVEPDSATVLVDGKPMGPARRYGGGMFGRGDWLELAPGRHRVTVTAPGYERRDLAVEVNDGADRERQKIDVSLARGEGG
ncbi:MAG TPA: serine/threonine-protein kinase [Thermoanaerobaculia bacterium]|nr:serine/threonine-protein kinase [Thermoanaerobaculia bacterium]